MTGLPVFDIEAINWVTPIAVGFFDGEEYHEFIRENERDDVIWRFLCYLKEHCQGFKLYAHYAARYDNKFILASLCQKSEVIEFQAGMVRLKWKGPEVTFEDSFLLAPMKLEELGQTFGSGGKDKWEHQENLPPWEMGDKLATFKAYMKRDCMLLSEGLYGVCETLGRNFGVMPSISLATTSAKAFSLGFYDLGKVEENEEQEVFIRQALYGGRNEVYQPYGENINLYDIKSMYVSCYDSPVPIGKMRWGKPNIDTGTLGEATVKVPKDWYIGPLPYRHNGLLVFPVGEFTGWWDLQELRNAAAMGVDINIRRQLVCEEEPIMERFGVWVTSLRKGKQENFWKLFGLTLAGKLGQSRWQETVQHYTTIRDFLGLVPMGPQETYFSNLRYKKHAPYIRPAITMRIHSEARVRHLRILEEALGKGGIFYCDTDSIFTDAKLPIGENVGELVYKGTASKGYFVKQKLYCLVSKNGHIDQRSAGYSDSKLTEEDFVNLLDGKGVEVEAPRLSAYIEVMANKEFRLLATTREITGRTNRSNRILDRKDTRPICLP